VSWRLRWSGGIADTGIAAATPSWASRPPRMGQAPPRAARAGVLYVVQCLLAVGYYVNGSSDDVVFAEAFTTLGWDNPVPSDSDRRLSSELSGVSCLSRHIVHRCRLLQQWHHTVALTTLDRRRSEYMGRPDHYGPTGSTYMTPDRSTVNPSTAVGYYYPSLGLR